MDRDLIEKILNGQRELERRDLRTDQLIRLLLFHATKDFICLPESMKVNGNVYFTLTFYTWELRIFNGVLHARATASIIGFDTIYQAYCSSPRWYPLREILDRSLNYIWYELPEFTDMMLSIFPNLQKNLDYVLDAADSVTA